MHDLLIKLIHECMTEYEKVNRYQVYTRNMNVKLNKIKENYYLELDLNWWRRGEDTWYAYLVLVPK